MKLFKLALSTLTAVVSAKTTINYDNKIRPLTIQSGLYSTNSSDYTNPFFAEFKKECLEDMKKVEEVGLCLIDIRGVATLDKLKEQCRVLFSEKCRKYYSNPLHYTPNCYNDQKMLKWVSTIPFILAENEFYCVVNGEGKTCPSVIKLLTKHEGLHEDRMEDCHSKICVNTHIADLYYTGLYSKVNYELNQSSIEDYNKANNITSEPPRDDDMEFYQGLIDEFSTKECLDKIKDDTTIIRYIFEDGKTSGAIKISTSILSLILLLYALF